MDSLDSHFLLACFESMLLILNEIDKRITFHRVLGVEAMARVGRYSNTEFLVKSWIMLLTAALALITAFYASIYNAIYKEETPRVRTH